MSTPPRDTFLLDIEEGRIDRTDGELALEFISFHATLQKLAAGTRKKYHFSLRKWLLRLRNGSKMLAELTEQDALELIQWLQNHPQWGEETRADYWDMFTRFYKWAHERHGPWDVGAHRLLAGEKKYIYRIDENNIEKKGILTPEEVLKLVHIEPDLAYKVFLSVLYESGIRAGEALSLRLRDVDKQENNPGFTLHLRKSKTDKRPIPLLKFSVTYLAKWLRLHPMAEDLDAPLFVNTFGEPLQNATANKHLRYLLKQAGIRKRKISLHSFRHSRATELSSMLNEYQMCRLFGWSIGSRMPATYIREGAIDVRGALLKGYGMEKEETHEIKGKGCLHCEHLNPNEAEYCDNCNLPLDPKQFEKLQEGVDALKSKELLKKLLKEMRGELIQEIKQEILQ